MAGEVLKPFEQCTGATVPWEDSNDFEAQIKVRIDSGNPPDVATSRSPVCCRRS